MKSNRFEVRVNGFPLNAASKVTGLTSSLESAIVIERPVKFLGDYFRDWISSGDERAVEIRLLNANGTTFISWTFSAQPIRHAYSDLGEDGDFTETIRLIARDIRVTDRHQDEDELGEGRDFTAPLAEDLTALAGEPQAKLRAAELPVFTVIRTVERGGYPFVFEKADEDTWYMTASTVSYPDSQVQVRIDGRETEILYLPGNSA